MSTTHGRYKKHSRRLSRKQLYGIAAAAIVVVSLIAIYSFHNLPNNGFSAAIIDQLSSTQEYTNTTFTQAASNTLMTTGYQVTYYKGSDVTVDFFQGLPTDGFKILIFRVHCALALNATGAVTAPLDFFTSEPYSSTAHGSFQYYNWLDKAVYNGTGNKNEYFGINPGFVTNAMEGSFQNATIILMGCNGLDGQLRSESMLQALVDRGAKVIIGWNASVSMPHTDAATDYLLYHLLVENETVKDAINATNKEIGLDTDYKNELLYYPSNSAPFHCGVDVGNYTIPHGPSKSAATNMGDNYILSSASEGVLALPLLLSAKGLCVSGKFRRKTFSVSHSVSKQ